MRQEIEEWNNKKISTNGPWANHTLKKSSSQIVWDTSTWNTT